MGGRKYFLLLFTIVLITQHVTADSSKNLEDECVNLCAEAATLEKADGDKSKWEEVENCFGKQRNDADTYLAVATCAYNNYADETSEKYAIKSANAKFAWIAFLRKLPGLNKVWKTGGTGETYTLAYMASGQLRHESKAIGFLKTSGQCIKSNDRQTCAEGYFNSVVQKYESRTIQAARTSGSTGLALSGRITDEFGDPIKHAKINFVCGLKEYVNVTDGNGQYRIPLPVKFKITDVCLKGKLYVKFEYHEPGNYSTIYTRVLHRGKSVWGMKKIEFKSENDLVQNFEIKQEMTKPEYDGWPNVGATPHYALVYKHMVEIIEFYKGTLKVNINYKLPVDVHAAHSSGKTYYSPTNSDIVIGLRDTYLTSSNRPMNREWHEFSHHAMFSMYKKWPRVPSTISSKNHDGYINPSTSDSWMEGFAEFMSMAFANEKGLPSPHVYAGFGSWEVDYKAWDKRGRAEEMAVAGVLWDLYDEKNDDKVDLTLAQIFNTLKPYHKDFTSVHDAFVKKFPGFKGDIDEIFKNHGFFIDKTPGDGNWTAPEPFRDANGDNFYDEGEYYIDYAIQPPLIFPHMIWEKGEKIGSAGNYQRQTRTNIEKLPGNFIKLDNDYPFYKVKVEFKDRPEYNYEDITENQEGFVYVQVPGQEYKTTITVTPALNSDIPSFEGITIFNGNPIVFESENFYENLETSLEQGYFTKHDFGNLDFEKEEKLDSQNTKLEPYWDNLDMEIEDKDFEIVAIEDEGLKGKKRFSFTRLLVLIVLIYFGYKVFVNRNKIKNSKHYKRLKKKVLKQFK